MVLNISIYEVVNNDIEYIGIIRKVFGKYYDRFKFLNFKDVKILWDFYDKKIYKIYNLKGVKIYKIYKFYFKIFLLVNDVWLEWDVVNIVDFLKKIKNKSL